MWKEISAYCTAHKFGGKFNATGDIYFAFLQMSMQQDSLEDISKHDKVQDVSPELSLAPRAVPDPAPA